MYMKLCKDFNDRYVTKQIIKNIRNTNLYKPTNLFKINTRKMITTTKMIVSFF